MSKQALAVRILPETERTLAFGGISGAYAKVGGPLLHEAIQVILQNQTDAAISFSWDGINAAITLAPTTSFILDVQSNRGVAQSMVVPYNTQFWVKQVAAPSLGAVYISILYGAV